MVSERSCAKCGRMIPWGEKECPLCSERRGYFWSLRRDTFLLSISLVLILLFVGTGFVVRSFHRTEARLAWDWNTRGDEALKSGHPEAALVDFRNALFHSRDNPIYQLRLAQALGATGQLPQARTYLLNLRERDPGNGTVNLELGRLAAREHDVSAALLYYHDAIYCEWEGDAVAQRRAVRLELFQFLVASDQKETARAELITVAANLPPDPALQTKVGTLLLEVGGFDDALRLFREAVATSPRLALAWAGAGECYFKMGRYTQAQHYLQRAIFRDPHLARAAAMLDTARTVLSMDPFYPRLDQYSAAHRATHDINQAMTHLAGCAAQRGIDLSGQGTDQLHMLYAEVAALKPRLRETDLQRDPNLLPQVMDLVFGIEKTTAQVCGEPEGEDLALLLIARQQEGAQP